MNAWRAAIFGVLLCSAVVLATESGIATVQPGETLEQLAARVLGDSGGADELRVLNHLGPGQPAAGTQLHLPGPERTRAVAAIGAARNALSQADGEGAQEAKQKLDGALSALRQAKYDEAAKAADQAWGKVAGATHGSAFTVIVDDEGKTEVKNRGGAPVRVEAQGVSKAVAQGEVVTVAKGQAPAHVQAPPSPPVAERPRADEHMKLRPDDKGRLGPLRLSWGHVEGATAYEVEVVPASGGKPLRLRSQAKEVWLPPLEAGGYQWSVKALAGTQASQSSPPQRFFLEVDPLKLEVKGTKWK